jgi:transcriptional repressor NrdR
VCGECKRRFTTYERLGPIDIKVVKRGDRASEPFDHGKLLASMTRVAAGRPLDADTIARVARHIEAELLDRGQSSVPSWDIADSVLARLEDLDAVAYNRYAADYLDENGRLRTAPRTTDGGHPSPPQLGLFGDDDGDA